MSRDYLAHIVIGTPLEGIGKVARRLWQQPLLRRHPELAELYKEPARIEQVVDRLVRNGMNCIDVGCHLGSFLHKLCRLSPGGKHTALEPTPYKARWLSKRYPQVEVHELAASDRRGEVDFFFYTRRSGFSGIRPQTRGSQPPIRQRVRCVPLDDVIPGNREIQFLKIDVEGAELSVLRGAQRLLTRCGPAVLFECGLGGLERSGEGALDLYAFLTQTAAYRVFLLKDWLAGSAPLKAPAFTEAIRYPPKARNFLAVR